MPPARLPGITRFNTPTRHRVYRVGGRLEPTATFLRGPVLSIMSVILVSLEVQVVPQAQLGPILRDKALRFPVEREASV